MGFLFKSNREREKEVRKERRRAFRQAENAVDSVKEQIHGMGKDADKQWAEAREALAAGEKAKAQRLLTSYRAAQVLMTKLEQKRWVFAQYMMKMEAAQTDTEFANALEKINLVTKVDPERVADVFAESQDLLGEQLDADKFWNRLYEKETAGAGSACEDYIPSMAELSQQLEAEAGQGAADTAGASRVAGELDQRIEAGRERVNDLLNGKS